MTNAKCSGFTLLEILAVVVIMGLSVGLMASVLSDKGEQKRLERTLESMEEIKKAILGTTSDRVRGDVRFAGYVPDMGALPGLYDVLGTPDDPSDDQPKGLWTNDPKGTPENKDDDLILFKPYTYEKVEFIRVGWRSSYITVRFGGVIVDGWANPFIFENNDGDLIVTSRGADKKKGGGGFDEDIVQTIKKRDYMGSVSGYVSPQSVLLENPVHVRIYYTPAVDIDCQPIVETKPDSAEKVGQYYVMTDCVDYMQTTAQPDGYFHFDAVPIGSQRLLLVVQERSECGYKLAVEPGTMWLGTLGLLH